MLLYVMDLSYKVYFVPPVALAQKDLCKFIISMIAMQ